MSGSLFQQCFCVLVDSRIELEQVRGSLAGFNPQEKDTPASRIFPEELASVRSRDQALNPESRLLGAKWLELPFFRTPGGRVIVDVVNEPWNDEASNADEDAKLYLAWSLGAFGPGTYAGGLERALGKGPTLRRDAQAIKTHQAHIRVRLISDMSVQAYEAESVLKRDFVAELEYLSWVTIAILEMPCAIAYFNPCGEILFDREYTTKNLDYSRSGNGSTPGLWVSRRNFDLGHRWRMIDTKGNAQLGLPDFEAFFESQRPAGEVDLMLDEVTRQLLADELAIHDDMAVQDANGLTWHGYLHEASLGPPSRPVITFKPEVRTGVKENGRQKGNGHG